MIDTMVALHAHRLPRRRSGGLRSSGGISRAPGAALGAAVGALEDRRAAGDRRARPRACARRCRLAAADDRARRFPPRQPGARPAGSGSRRRRVRLGDGDARRSARRSRLHADLLGRSRRSDRRGQHRQRLALHHAARLPAPRRPDRRVRAAQRPRRRPRSTSIRCWRSTSSRSSARASTPATCRARRSATGSRA